MESFPNDKPIDQDHDETPQGKINDTSQQHYQDHQEEDSGFSDPELLSKVSLETDELLVDQFQNSCLDSESIINIKEEMDARKENSRSEDQDKEVLLKQPSLEIKKHADLQRDVVEIKEMLMGVVQTQKMILNEIRSIKDDSRKNATEMNSLLESQRCVCKDYTDAQVRGVECKVNGLAAVLDHVQKIYMETEIQQHGTDREYESLTSSDSARDSVDDMDACEEEAEDVLSEIIKGEKNRKWLRQNHLKLIEHFDPRNDQLVLHLAQDNILSVSDEEKIMSQDTRKNQARELVLKLRRCSPSQFQLFLNHLKAEHPHLACLSSVDDDTGEADNVQQCVVCDVTKLVDVDDVIDYVYQQGFLDGVAFETVWKTGAAEDKWRRLLDKLTRKSDGIHVLVEALSRKYPVISQRLAISRQSSLECCCPPQKTRIK